MPRESVRYARASLKRRVWSEHVPYETVARRDVLDLLVRYGLELCLAVRPGGEASLPALLDACASRGVRVNLWPMLDDEAGRWANERNAGVFSAWVRRLVDGLEQSGAMPPEIVFDLEPPIAAVRALAEPARAARLAIRRGWPRRERGPRVDDRERDPLGGLVAELGARGIAASCAVVPLVLAGGGWGRLLGTRVGPDTWDHMSVMLYSSIIEGWSRGVLSRADVRAVLHRGCRATMRRFGARGGVSVGAVGTGALGNEPVYRDPAELADDVAVARAAGVDALTLFDLGGVLARAPADAWLEAFVHTEAVGEPPAPTRASRAAAWLVTSVSQAGGSVLRSSESLIFGSKR